MCPLVDISGIVACSAGLTCPVETIQPSILDSSEIQAKANASVTIDICDDEYAFTNSEDALRAVRLIVSYWASIGNSKFNPEFVFREDISELRYAYRNRDATEQYCCFYVDGEDVGPPWKESWTKLDCFGEQSQERHQVVGVLRTASSAKKERLTRSSIQPGFRCARHSLGEEDDM